MRRFVRAWLCILALVAASFAIAAPASADVDDFSFESLDVDYTLTRDADGSSALRVVERFTAVFPETDQNHGMRRLIPTTYNKQPNFPELVSITDGDGRERESETDTDDGAYSMTSRSDAFVHGRQTYVFTYTLENVTWRFDDTAADEFYWDVNGVDWPQTFGDVTARLHVSADLADALTGDQACYRGAQNSTDRCAASAETEPDGTVVITADGGALDAHETATMSVGFAEGTFVRFDTSPLASVWSWPQIVAAIGAAGAFVFALVTRRRRLGDEPGRPTIVAEFTPPPRIDALESAVLLGTPSKGIPAEVLEQAVVGSIRIVEGGKRAFGGMKLKAELIDPSRADDDGRMLLDGLFGRDARPGAEFEFGRSDTRFSSAAQKILAEAGKKIGQRGFRRPVAPGVRVWPIVVAVVAAGLALGFGIAVVVSGVNALVAVLLIVVTGIVAVLVCIIVARVPLSAAGAETRDHLLGLKLFIEWAEADRIRMLQSPSGAERVRVDVDDPRQMLTLYERLLPYAVIFGQEKDWAARIAVLYGAAAVPYWYVGTGAFDASAFSAGIGSLSTSASSASSTSGGSSGGGSAGGGGGGGGGGGV